MTKHVTWLHKVVYTMAGKALVYDEISMLCFIQGYLITRNREEAIRTQLSAHLKDLLADSELYGWDKVHAYHAVWLNQFKQGHVSWDD